MACFLIVSYVQKKRAALGAEPTAAGPGRWLLDVRKNKSSLYWMLYVKGLILDIGCLQEQTRTKNRRYM